MTYFVPLAVSEAEAGESRDEIVADKLMVLSNERGEGGVPVFRSLRSFEAFVEAYGGDTEIAPWPTDPFRLAELLAVVDEPHRPEWVVISPGALSPTGWGYQKAVPVRHFCRFAQELYPDVRAVVREEMAELGEQWPDPVTLQTLMVRNRTRIDRMVREAGVRAGE